MPKIKNLQTWLFDSNLGFRPTRWRADFWPRVCPKRAEPPESQGPTWNIPQRPYTFRIFKNHFFQGSRNWQKVLAESRATQKFNTFAPANTPLKGPPRKNPKNFRTKPNKIKPKRRNADPTDPLRKKNPEPKPNKTSPKPKRRPSKTNRPEHKPN